MDTPGQVAEPLKMVQLWLHESERTYGDRLVSVSDLKKYKELAVEQVGRRGSRETGRLERGGAAERDGEDGREENRCGRAR